MLNSFVNRNKFFWLVYQICRHLGRLITLILFQTYIVFFSSPFSSLISFRALKHANNGEINRTKDTCD